MCGVTSLTRGSTKTVVNTFLVRAEAGNVVHCSPSYYVNARKIIEVKGGFDLMVEGKIKYIYRFGVVILPKSI